MLSRLSTLSEEEKGESVTLDEVFPNCSETESHFFSLFDDPELFECFLHLPESYLNLPPVDWDHRCPVNYDTIYHEQMADQVLQAKLQNDPQNYQVEGFGHYNVPLIIMRSPPDIWRIAIPDALLERAVRWYHQVLNHPGMDRTKKTMAAHYWHPNLESMVRHVVSTCDPCLRYKLPGVGYGELPPRVPELLPWREVIVDLIGPWPLPMKVQGKEITIHALTCIDPVSNLCEIIQVPSTKSNDVAIAFQN